METFIKRRCRKLPPSFRILLAEMMGTFILLIFGIGSVAQLVFGKGQFGNWLSLTFGWGIGVMLGVYWSFGVSGGHLNPAVTLAMSVVGRLPWKKLPFYWGGQTIGAFLASSLAYGIYYDLLVEFEGSVRSIDTAKIWSTYPAVGVTNKTVFGDQFVGTAILVATIFALTDKRNNPPKPHILPLIVGFLVVAIGISFGINVGYGINPARDLIPRLFTALAGWDEKPFQYQDYFFWIPVVAQLLGGVTGAFVYIFAIELHHPDMQCEIKKPEEHVQENPYL